MYGGHQALLLQEVQERVDLSVTRQRDVAEADSASDHVGTPGHKRYRASGVSSVGAGVGEDALEDLLRDVVNAGTVV